MIGRPKTVFAGSVALTDRSAGSGYVVYRDGIVVAIDKGKSLPEFADTSGVAAPYAAI